MDRRWADWCTRLSSGLVLSVAPCVTLNNLTHFSEPIPHNLPSPWGPCLSLRLVRILGACLCPLACHGNSGQQQLLSHTWPPELAAQVEEQVNETPAACP